MRTCQTQASRKASVAICALIILGTAGCSSDTFQKDWNEPCVTAPKLLFSAVTEEGETLTVVVTNKGRPGGARGENADCTFDVVFRWYQDNDLDHIENGAGGSADKPRCKGQAVIKA